MNDELKELSESYRNSRRTTSFWVGIGIAWSAAQFDLKIIPLGSLGKVNIEGASIPIIISILCLYLMGRSTIEYMMQSDIVRRWPLAQLDYCITSYLLRFSLIALAGTAILRNGKMVLFLVGSILGLVAGFFILVYALIHIIMPLRMYIREKAGRISAANSAIESVFYSIVIVGLFYTLLILLMGFDVIQPFAYLGIDRGETTGFQLFLFSLVCLTIFVSVFFERKFFNIVFAFEPIMITTSTRDKDGREIFSHGPNPAHPDYEKHKDQQPLVFSEVEEKEKDEKEI
jgi:hypothetical protein